MTPLSFGGVNGGEKEWKYRHGDSSHQLSEKRQCRHHCCTNIFLDQQIRANRVQVFIRMSQLCTVTDNSQLCWNLYLIISYFYYEFVGKNNVLVFYHLYYILAMRRRVWCKYLRQNWFVLTLITDLTSSDMKFPKAVFSDFFSSYLNIISKCSQYNIIKSQYTTQ